MKAWDVHGKSRLILPIAGLCLIALWAMAARYGGGLAVVGFAAGLGTAYLIGLRRNRDGIAHDSPVEMTLNALPDAVIQLDGQGRPVYLNAAAETMLGLASGELDDGWRIIDHQTRSSQLEHLLAQARREGLIRLQEGARLVNRQGLEVEVVGSCQPIRGDGGEVDAYLLQLHDVTEEREWRRLQPDMWDRDPVSALPGRNFMENRLNQALQNKRASDLPLSYLRLGLTGIQQVYEQAGTTAGDTLVRHLAALLRAHVRDTDLIARLDEQSFGLLLAHCPVEISRRIADGVRTSLTDFAFEWQGQSYAIVARLGQADAPPFDGGLDDLLAAADSDAR